MNLLKVVRFYMFLKKLKTFQVVAEEGNFSQAAIKLNYTQSTVSKHIQSLEEELNTKLLIRKQGNYQLTKSGHKLFQHSIIIHNELKGIVELSINQDTEVELRLQGHNYYCFEYFIPAIERLKSIYPRIHFIVRTSNNQETVNQLMKNEIDIGIVSGNLMPNSLEFYQIDKEAVGICVGEHLYQPDLTVEDYVTRYPLILDESDVYQTANIFPYLKHPIDIIDTDSDEVVHRTLMRNKFVGVVRLGRLKEEIENGTIKVIDKIVSASPVYIVTNKQSKELSYVRAFIEVLKEMTNLNKNYHVKFR